MNPVRDGTQPPTLPLLRAAPDALTDPAIYEKQYHNEKIRPNSDCGPGRHRVGDRACKPAVDVQCGPSPKITPSMFHFGFHHGAFLLAPHKSPHRIPLESFAFQIPHGLVLICREGRAKLNQQILNRCAVSARHPHSGAQRITLTQPGNTRTFSSILSLFMV